MAMYRKLGRTSDQRKALLRNQVTALIWHGSIKTTEARAKEIRKIADELIALAAKECDNFETVKVKSKVAVKNVTGKRDKKDVDGKKATEYTEVEKEIKKDNASRLNARRRMKQVLYPVSEGTRMKKTTKHIDLADKLLDELGPKYKNRKGGYTRIVKIGERKGDASMEVILELV